ncbi:MAG: type II secretion system F family protein [Candidatus Woesearchaeota archaeon]
MSKKSSFTHRLRAFFSRDKLSKDLKKVKELSDKEMHKEDLKKRLFSSSQKKKKSSYQHVRLERLLAKAGVEMSVSSYQRMLFSSALLCCLLGFFFVVFVAVSNDFSLLFVLVFSAVLFTLGLFGVWLLCQLVASFVLDMKIDARRREVEEVLPDFLQLTAANIGAGMPIDRALWYAVRPRFGVLAKEVEVVAKHVLTGEELDEALMQFTKKYDSLLLTRSINLLLEGIAAGSHIADLLHKISVDIQDQRILQEEMAANVMTYVIFIGFAAVLAAPILFGLATQLLVVISSIVSNLGDGGSSAMFSISTNAIRLVDFRVFSFVVLTGSATISALIIGVIQSGSSQRGVRLIPVFVAVSLVLYVVSASLFAGLFGGLF